MTIPSYYWKRLVYFALFGAFALAAVAFGLVTFLIVANMPELSVLGTDTGYKYISDGSATIAAVSVALAFGALLLACGTAFWIVWIEVRALP